MPHLRTGSFGPTYTVSSDRVGGGRRGLTSGQVHISPLTILGPCSLCSIPQSKTSIDLFITMNSYGTLSSCFSPAERDER
ncbi:hypothetical protein RRG08_012272 [Elysia crispata]|uniref:Uncharacterized protein n=1 Tax=Elysia crispata TaxID=231223 RepID=A0AAE1EDC1_9GAST|nr:hypothetical protein RRG08_012272 [Elysia crispata]